MCHWLKLRLATWETFQLVQGDHSFCSNVALAALGTAGNGCSIYSSILTAFCSVREG